MLEALKKKFFTSKQVLNKITNLNEISSSNSVCLKWVKAHVGHPGNETADKLAKNGADLLEDPIVVEGNKIPVVTGGFIRSSIREKVVTNTGNLIPALGRPNYSYLK